MNNCLTYQSVDDMIFSSDYNIQVQVNNENNGNHLKDYFCSFKIEKTMIDIDLNQLFFYCNDTYEHNRLGLKSNISLRRKSYDFISLVNQDICIDLIHYHDLIVQVKRVLLDYYKVDQEFISYLTVAGLNTDITLLEYYFEKGCKEYYYKVLHEHCKSSNISFHDLLTYGKDSDDMLYYKLYRYEPGFQGCYEDEYGRKRPITGRIEYRIDSKNTTPCERFIVNTFRYLLKTSNFSKLYLDLIRSYLETSAKRIFVNECYRDTPMNFTLCQGAVDLMRNNINDVSIGRQ